MVAKGKWFYLLMVQFLEGYSVNPFPPMSVEWHLYILLCLTPDDFTRQWGTP